MPIAEATRERRRAGFRHEALLFADADEFLAAAVPFVVGAVEAGDPVLVAVTAPRARMLAAELERAGVETGGSDAVRFTAMEELGRNPARIIPAWRRFVAERADGGGRAWGIGEPVWPGRTADELVECAHHESLLNRAFGADDRFTLLCPYDTAALPPEEIEAARRTHPELIESGERRRSALYDAERAERLLLEQLAPPPADRLEVAVESPVDLPAARTLVAVRAEAAGLDSHRRADLVLAVNEVATNALTHGRGPATLRIWETDDELVCEVADAGRITEPLVGRSDPDPDQGSGRGLWLVHQLCDLVQLRAPEHGNVVRMHMRRR